MNVFLSHTGTSYGFVLPVERILKFSMGNDNVFTYKAPEKNRANYITVINKAIAQADIMVVFVSDTLTDWQESELNGFLKIGNPPSYYSIYLNMDDKAVENFRRAHNLMSFDLEVRVDKTDEKSAIETARQILQKLQVPFSDGGGLPLDPHLFEYEKYIIDFYKKVSRLGPALWDDPGENWTPEDVIEEEIIEYRDDGNNFQNEPLAASPTIDELREREKLWRNDARDKLSYGCPIEWPKVERWEEIIRDFRGRWQGIVNWTDKPYKSRLRNVVFRQFGNDVLTAALSNYHNPKPDPGSMDCIKGCMLRQGYCFPEAGPRKALYFPPRPNSNSLSVAVLVSGGIAPGINAVIDGIVQRHWLYARTHEIEAGLAVYGVQNGFYGLNHFLTSHYILVPDKEVGQPTSRFLVTSDHANEGGAMLGTSRLDALLNLDKRTEILKSIVDTLRSNNIDILYVIGGDGSMKAAHAIWSIARNDPNKPLSVVTVPKTMDNDVLWVWQSFGFLSAVEKAKEVIENLHTEVKSNPRLCIVQLFGSDSGFVVSHSVLASATGHCDVALIPEVPFSMTKLAEVLREKICKRGPSIPYGLVVMAETAIPTDATNYVAEEGKTPRIDIGLSRDEQDEIIKFQKLRDNGKRIEGQTNDNLRTAGIKIVSRGLPKLLSQQQNKPFEPDWDKLQIITNEPRHLIRSISPSCSDIIFGQRLGMLAVDNAMAGYTDFMISQWLTEYVVVPLKLVTLGRKRIPSSGIFWKSVRAKTGQPENIVD